MVVGTGRIDIIELGHIIKKNLVPFLETLAKFSQIHRDPEGGYIVDLSKYKNEEEFISQVGALAKKRVTMVSYRLKRVRNYLMGNSIFPVILFLSLFLAFLGSGIGTNNIAGNVVFAVGLILLFIGWIPPILLPYIFARRVREMHRIFPKIVNYLDTHEDFALISELAKGTSCSKRQIVKTITTFGEGRRREKIHNAIAELADRNFMLKEITNINTDFPPEDLFYFIPQINGVIKVPKIVNNLQLNKSELDTIWGMLLFEKRIDFTITSEELALPKYHLLRGIFRILSMTSMKFRFNKNSIELLEEKDLDRFFTALKEEFSDWKMPSSPVPRHSI